MPGSEQRQSSSDDREAPIRMLDAGWQTMSRNRLGAVPTNVSTWMSAA